MFKLADTSLILPEPTHAELKTWVAGPRPAMTMGMGMGMGMGRP
jgi:hypothetical protein